MKSRLIILFFLLWCPVFAGKLSAQGRRLGVDVVLRDTEKSLLTFNIEDAGRAENPRLTAALLCVALGPFAMHRIYLGTDVKVPVFYTLTLGGGLGFLPVLDLLHILLVRDLQYFYANPRVFMFTGRPEKAGRR